MPQKKTIYLLHIYMYTVVHRYTYQHLPDYQLLLRNLGCLSVPVDLENPGNLLVQQHRQHQLNQAHLLDPDCQTVQADQ